MRFRAKQTKELLEVLDSLRREFFPQNKEFEHDWHKKRKEVEQRVAMLPKLIEEAACLVKIKRKAGRKPKLSIAEKTSLLIFAIWMCKSNRDMADSLTLLKPLIGKEVSYKTIERLYSDPEVKACLYNLFILLLKDSKKEFAGDGTGFSLSITKHYASNPRKKGKAFRYMFSLVDLSKGMCVAIGYSCKSEMEAFKEALEMVGKLGIKMESIALDKYYSSRKVIGLFDKEVKLYILPKRNLRRIGFRWLRVFKLIMEDPLHFLQAYFRRNLVESYFSSLKRRFGWQVRQRRDDRIRQCLMVRVLLNNIFTVRSGRS